jgi:CO dehydrogenase/acetyl-CoA synthase alpha subunit
MLVSFYYLVTMESLKTAKGPQTPMEMFTYGVPPLAMMTSSEYRKNVAAPGAEIASYLLPAGKLAQGASSMQKIKGAAKTGGLLGGLLGITNPDLEQEGKTLVDRAKSTAIGAGTGAVLSGGMQSVGELAKGTVKKFVESAPSSIRKIIRPTPTAVGKFKKATDNMSFEEEILNRDANKIKGNEL